MKHIKIKDNEIKTASENGIVATWSDQHDCAVVVMTDQSAEIFSGDVVDIVEKEQSE